MTAALCFLVFLSTLMGVSVLQFLMWIVKDGRKVMAKLDDVLKKVQQVSDDLAQVVIQESAQIKTLVQTLKDQISAGNAATPADLDKVVAALDQMETNAKTQIDTLSDSVS